MKFLRVVLETPADLSSAMSEFYGRTLGVEETVGETELVFRDGGEGAFYHFALLVPGDRFDAAREWIASRADLLDGGDIDGVVFDFDNWGALALYFHDPAGNIVELIAHKGLEENGRIGPFDASELLGVSEVGLVGDQDELARSLGELGLHLWDGVLEPGRLAFVGERGRTFIVAPEGRGWLPTGRPAEPHPVEAVVTGPRPVGAAVARHRITVSPS